LISAVVRAGRARELYLRQTRDGISNVFLWRRQAMGEAVRSINIVNSYYSTNSFGKYICGSYSGPVNGRRQP
jgi:hypothetical protein